ncbi:MAG: POTRA domain-containing protein [Vulcanimicrobiota bacterium]
MTVNGFSFEGNTRLSSEKLETVLEDLKGQNLTLQELKGAADRLTDLHRKEGYFTVRAAVPAQDISGGIVRFEIVENKLGQVKIQGNERYSTEFLRWYVEPIEKMEIPDQSLVHRQILLLNEFPELEASTIVHQGEEPGTVDLTVEVVDDHPTHFTIDYTGVG